MSRMGRESAKAATQSLETTMAVGATERRIVMVPWTIDVMVMDEECRFLEMVMDGMKLFKIVELVDDDIVIDVRTAQGFVQFEVVVKRFQKTRMIPSRLAPCEINLATMLFQQAGRFILIVFDTSLEACES